MTKPVKSFRLSNATRSAIADMATARRCSEAEIVTIAIDRMYTQETSTMKIINGIEYFLCGTGDLGEALAAYLVAQYAGHRIERNGTHYYHNAAFSLEMYQAYAAEAVR